MESQKFGVVHRCGPVGAKLGLCLVGFAEATFSPLKQDRRCEPRLRRCGMPGQCTRMKGSEIFIHFWTLGARIKIIF